MAGLLILRRWMACTAFYAGLYLVRFGSVRRGSVRFALGLLCSPISSSRFVALRLVWCSGRLRC
eukprot:596317-Alexandrium_andersonii.AAC.1